MPAHRPQAAMRWHESKACARRRTCGNRRWNSGSTLAQKALPQSGITAESLKTLFDPSQWAQAGLGPLDAAIEHLVEGPELCDAMDARPQDPQGAEAARGVGEGPRRVSAADARRMERGRQALPAGNQRRAGHADHDLAGIDRRVDQDRQRNAARDPSHTGVSGGTTPADALRRRVPLAGTRDRRGILRNAADADANGDGRSAARGVRAAPPLARAGEVGDSRCRSRTAASPNATKKASRRGARRAPPKSTA